MFSLKMKVAIFSMVIAVAASDLESCTRTRRGSIRLQGGQNSSHGRVELCLNRHWRALCANHWEDADAQVACRELGFSATGAVAVSSGFVNTNYGRWLYRFKCYGDENRVINCPWETAESCGPTCRDAGVRCTEGFQPRAFQETMAPRRLVKSNFSANKQEEPTTPPHSLNEIELIGTNRNITLFVAAPNLTVIGTFTPNVKKGIWGLYTQPNYMGTRIMVPAASSQAEAAITKDALQSVKPLTGEIILYANRDYTGRSLVFTESTPNLSVYNFNNMASSAQVISGKWKLFKDFEYESTYYTTSGNPESFPSIPEALKSALSSMKFVPKA